MNGLLARLRLGPTRHVERHLDSPEFPAGSACSSIEPSCHISVLPRWTLGSTVMIRGGQECLARLSRTIVTGVLSGLTATAAAAPGAGCPSEVRDALESWGRDGVHRAAAVIRSEGTGIGRPESVFDLTCLTDLFKAPGLYTFVEPGAITDVLLRQMRNFVCEVGEDLYREHVDRPIQEMVFWDELHHVSGEDVGANWRNRVVPPEIPARPLEDTEGSTGSYRDARWFRHAIGGSQ